MSEDKNKESYFSSICSQISSYLSDKQGDFRGSAKDGVALKGGKHRFRALSARINRAPFSPESYLLKNSGGAGKSLLSSKPHHFSKEKGEKQPITPRYAFEEIRRFLRRPGELHFKTFSKEEKKEDSRNLARKSDGLKKAISSAAKASNKEYDISQVNKKEKEADEEKYEQLTEGQKNHNLYSTSTLKPF